MPYLVVGEEDGCQGSHEQRARAACAAGTPPGGWAGHDVFAAYRGRVQGGRRTGCGMCGGVGAWYGGQAAEGPRGYVCRRCGLWHCFGLRLL